MKSTDGKSSTTRVQRGAVKSTSGKGSIKKRLGRDPHLEYLVIYPKLRYALALELRRGWNNIKDRERFYRLDKLVAEEFGGVNPAHPFMEIGDDDIIEALSDRDCV